MKFTDDSLTKAMVICTVKRDMEIRMQKLETVVPNLQRKWRAVTALIDTDWYPASYPWHTVIELDPSEKKITMPATESNSSAANMRGMLRR